MTTKFAAVLLVGLLAAGLLAPVCADDDTEASGPNSDVTHWFVEARFFDAGGNAGDWDTNRTYSIGFSRAVDEKTDFSLMYANTRTLTDEAAVRTASDRRVLAPVIKRRINSMESKWALSATLGAEVATAQTELRLGTTTLREKDFIPAGGVDIMWGKPGETQWGIGVQGALFDTRLSPTIPGYGSVLSVGGGVMYPVSKKWTVGGTISVPIEGDNYFDEVTQRMEREVVWLGGIVWNAGDAANTMLGVFATNALSPTLAGSLLASPENAVGIGACVMRDF